MSPTAKKAQQKELRRRRRCWTTPAPPTADPFAHPDTQRCFCVVENQAELAAALDAPWERWMVFLHSTAAISFDILSIAGIIMVIPGVGAVCCARTGTAAVELRKRFVVGS